LSFISEFEDESATKMASDLILALESRFKTVLQNVCMKMCRFLDPRFKETLNVTDYDNVREHLSTLYKRVHELKGENSKPSPTAQSSTSSSSADQNDNLTRKEADSDTLLAKYIDSLASQNRNIEDEWKNLFRYELKSYREEKKENLNSNPFDFWKIRKDKYPRLSQIVDIIFSIPGTQVSVERLFSSVHFILNEYRSTLSTKHLNDILLIRSNFQYIDMQKLAKDVP